jgi:sorting nexin-4
LRIHENTTNGQLQDAVTTAHETSTAFSDEVIKEHDVFELSKQQEMKEMMETYADGQVEMFQRVSRLLKDEILET